MNNKTRLSIKVKLLFYVIFIAFLTQSCVGMVHHSDMDIISKEVYPQILNLQASKSMKYEFLEQAERLVSGHLCKNTAESYGYYVIKYNTIRDERIPTGVVVSLSIPVGALLFLLGTPTDGGYFWIEANLYIFDSNGVLLKKYSDGDVFEQIAGIYYGHDPTEKAAKAYSEVYDRMFKKALQDAEFINTALRKSGVITKENDAIAEFNIKAFLDAE